MITQLEIKNFRGFSDYTIDDVGQVNLLVGTNNCGKTSVLEAVYLLKQRGSKQSLSAVLLHRGEQLLATTAIGRPIVYGDLCRLFHGFQLTPKSAFSILAQDIQIDRITTHEIESFAVYMQPNDRSESLDSVVDSVADVSEYYQLYTEWCKGAVERKKSLYVKSNGGLITSNAAFKEEEDGYVYSELIYTASLSPREVVFMFENIVLTPEEDLLIEAVKILDPDITRLATHGESGFSSSNSSRGGILVKSKKWERRIPIGSFGDGIWRLLGLALSLVGAKNGTLLIDEIDTGLHHTVMSKMWKLICATAKKLNVQVFATTHSRDCWETLADNAVEDEFADMPIRIHRIDKDMKKAETFTNKEINLALNRDLEVR